jgi:acetyl-CoA carboxylase carboxyl transferase subunit alpha
MLEHSIYSVISPEGCAAILWGDASKSSTAAAALRMTAPELLKLNIIDDIIPEPLGGAHRDISLTVQRVSKTLETHFNQLEKIPLPKLLKQRKAKFRSLGAFSSLQEGTKNKVKTANS